MLFKPLFAASFVALVVAQGEPSSTSTPSSSASAATVTVKVSDEQVSLKFDPEVIRANPGDTVVFQFFPNNHSVAESSFDSPCEPLDEDYAFWSGFMPVSPNSPTIPTFSISITDDEPRWFYCATGKHCQAGMVGVINPPSDGSDTLDEYKTAAVSVPSTIAPEGSEFGGSGSGSGSGNETGGGLNATVTSGSTPTSEVTADASSIPTGGAGTVGAKGWVVSFAGLLAAGALVI